MKGKLVGMAPTKKHMACVDCGQRILATTSAASRHGWRFWMGGAYCARCNEFNQEGNVTKTSIIEEKMSTPPARVTCLICLSEPEET